MKIFPAIDIYDKKAVRLYKGDYDKMTVYAEDPVTVALDFKSAGAKNVHVVDLEGARSGNTDNLEVIEKIVKESGLFVEVGGGIRSLEVLKRYLDIGVSRVILGTAAVTNPEFLEEALRLYADKVAVSVDIKDGFVAIKGWTEKSAIKGVDFLKDLESKGVKTVIVTDISKDGAMQGTNLALYREIKEKTNLNVIASGGVSSESDLENLSSSNVYGAIIGKAYYTGAINLKKVIKSYDN